VRAKRAQRRCPSAAEAGASEAGASRAKRARAKRSECERSEHKDDARMRLERVAGAAVGGRPPQPPAAGERGMGGGSGEGSASLQMCSAAHVLGRTCARPHMCSAAHVLCRT
jgi:hypothetical protein